MFVPQELPSLRLVPESGQVWTPVLHEVVPEWHGFNGVHVLPAVQATQVPPLHTWFAPPHAVPLLTLVPVSPQTCEPVLHEFAPT
jgi:hypothetical protein